MNDARTPARRASLLTPLLAGLLFAANPASAGIYYRAVTTSDVDQQEVTVEAWIDAANARIEFQQSGNPLMPAGSYLLTRDAGRRLYLVNPEEKTYAVWDLEAMLRAVGGLLDAMGPMMNLEISDPQVSKLAEEPGGTLAGYATTHHRYRTSYRMAVKVLGMKRADDVELLQDFWVTNELDAPALGIWLRTARPTGNDQLDRLVDAEMEKVQGFPLKTVSVTTTTGAKKKRRQQTTRTETVVTELDANRSIPASSFEIPAGYQETQMLPAAEQGKGEDNPLKGLFGGGKG